MLVNAIVQTLQVYGALGLVFGLAFILRGARRIDPAAETGTWGFRLLILPGAAALWPLLFVRWLAAARSPAQGNGGTSE